MDEWTNKIWYILIQWNTIQSLKKNEILSFALTWMDLKDMNLSEINQTEKDKYI